MPLASRFSAPALRHESSTQRTAPSLPCTPFPVCDAVVLSLRQC